jgi:hypothetical protein
MVGHNPLKREDVITASEIGQFVYCSMSWYLQRHGFKPLSSSLEVGEKAHVDLGKVIDDIEQDMKRAKRYRAVSCLFLICAIIIVIFEVIL